MISTRTMSRCLAVAALAASTLMPRAQAAPIPEEYKQGGFAIGCQAYSFNRYTSFEAIEKTAEAGGRVIEFYPGQKLAADDETKMGPGMSAEAIQKLKDKLAKHNVKAVAFGVTGIAKDEAGARPLFEWAKTMDIGILNTESTDAIDMIEKMVKEYDIKVGYHNHPRQANNPNYKVWDPNYVLELVKNRDMRVGACADTGHWVRSGIKPVDAMKILSGRIVSSHLKDLHVFAGNGHDMPYGQGVSDVPGILDEFKRQNFTGSISVEYEHNWDKSVPEIAQCIGFVRGYGRAQNRVPNRVASSEDRVTAPNQQGFVKYTTLKSGFRKLEWTTAKVGQPIQLFNGRDLTGWKWVAGDGKTPLENVWKVEDGILKCNGKPAGYIRTEKDYTNYILRLQWRFSKPGNSGVLMRMIGEDKVWPRSIEAQLHHQNAGDIWNIDKFPMKVDMARTQDRHTVKLKPTNERPMGEWNDYEITLVGSNLEMKVNGLVQNTATEVLETPGKLCLQSEGAAIEFRNIMLTPVEK